MAAETLENIQIHIFFNNMKVIKQIEKFIEYNKVISIKNVYTTTVDLHCPTKIKINRGVRWGT